MFEPESAVVKVAIKLGCALESWIYEILGVLGLSLCANLFVSGCSAAKSPGLWLWIAVLSWGMTGSIALYCSMRFRQIESVYVPEADKTLRKYLLEQLPQYPQTCHAVLGLILSLGLSVVLTVLWAL